MHEDEADAISIEDILVLRTMAERLEEALLLAEGRSSEQLVGLLRQAKAWVDATLSEHPSCGMN